MWISLVIAYVMWRYLWIFPQMSWERDMDEQLTPEAWANMQKLSSSVRHVFIILRFINREIHDVHEIMLYEESK